MGSGIVFLLCPSFSDRATECSMSYEERERERERERAKTYAKPCHFGSTEVHPTSRTSVFTFPMQRGPGPLEARAVDAKWGIDPGQGEACKVGVCVCVNPCS